MPLVDGRTVRELANTNPQAARIFEKFGIDYCCGGEKPLGQACRAANVSVQEVVDALEKPPSAEMDRDWQTASLAEVIQEIVGKHHAFVRAEIPRLTSLLAKVVGVHGEKHEELGKIERSFHALAEELSMHLLKEERMLFPYIEQLEAAAKRGDRPTPPMFGTVQNPVRMMVMEHDSAGDLLREMRQVTKDYALPEEACMSFRMLYRALEEFEADLHRHIHLENNFLFPRAITLEAQAL